MRKPLSPAKLKGAIGEAACARHGIQGEKFLESVIAFGHSFGVNLGHILADESRTERRDYLLTLLGVFINVGRGCGLFDFAVRTPMGPLPAQIKMNGSSDLSMCLTAVKDLHRAGAPLWIFKVTADIVVPTFMIGEVEMPQNMMMQRINFMDLLQWVIDNGENPWEIAEKGAKDNRAVYTRLDRGYPRMSIRWSKVPAHLYMDAEPVPFAAELPEPTKRIIPKKIRPLICRGPFRVFMHKVEVDGEVVIVRKGIRDLLRKILQAKPGEYVTAPNRQTISKLRERLGEHGKLIKTKSKEGLYLAV